MAITWVCFYHFGFALGPIESQLLKMKEPGESIIDLLQLINQDMNSGTKFQNRSVTITQNFIISPSKYSFNICRQSVAQLKVVQARELTQQNQRTDHARVMNMTYYTILVTAQDASFRIFVHTGRFLMLFLTGKMIYCQPKEFLIDNKPIRLTSSERRSLT